MNNPRSFNKIEVSEDGQRIIKYSSNFEKNLQEFTFLEEVPTNLKHYFPRVFTVASNRYELEYWPLKSLSELFVYWGLPDPVWRQVACSILLAVKEFRSVSRPNQDFNEFNSKKLMSRISKYPEEILSIFDEPFIKINGKKYIIGKGFLEGLTEKLRTEDENYSGSFVHGDLCFSNILYSPDSGILKFIDPRGQSDDGCNLTSIQYDLAKLLHSFHGLYDFIVQDFFEILSHARNDFSFRVFSTSESSNVSSIFLQEIVKVFPELSLRNLKLIEASLFFSMIPLHGDSRARQLAFLFRAIQILDDCH